MPDETPSDFARWLLSCHITPPEEFRPMVNHVPEGDAIEAHWSNETYFGEWICPGLTLYRGRSSGQVVGVFIDGLSRIMEGKS